MATRRMAQGEADRDFASAIEEFGKKYKEETVYWTNLLFHVHQKCDGLLRGKVQGSVTSRVKEWTSLEKKIKKSYLELKDSEVEDREVKVIKADDIHDIAALRIRAFFPKQLSTIYKIVEDNFEVQRTKTFKPDWKNPDKLEAYDKRFGNYEGQHYWVKLNEDDRQDLPPELRGKFENQTIEIQVRSSILLDGWAEVRHDVQYKALGGAPSRGERELLDTMKGVIKSMEVLLDHLFDVHKDRVKSDNTKLETAPLLEQALVRALP